MITYFGIPGEFLSLITQIIAFVCSFALGLLGCRRHLWPMAICFGTVANFVGQMIFAGGGPGAFVGMFILPLYCVCTAYGGRGLWWLALRRPEKKS